MKTIDFKLDRFQMDQFFSAVRTKNDIIKIWMRATKIMIAYAEPDNSSAVGTMRLHVDKMSRLFFLGDDKTFSINFPFFVQIDGSILNFSSATYESIDSRVTSEILALITNHNVLDVEDIYLFLDPFSPLVDFDSNIWSLFKHLMTCDDGYIRFDHDVARENGNLHPRDHLDIFYSGATTFKLGLSSKLTIEEFTSILDVGTDCHFLHRK